MFTILTDLQDPSQTLNVPPMQLHATPTPG